MPSYEFICRQCGERFTVMIPYSKKEEVSCPRCQSDRLQELFGFSFVSSGSGGCAAADGGCSFG